MRLSLASIALLMGTNASAFTTTTTTNNNIGNAARSNPNSPTSLQMAKGGPLRVRAIGIGSSAPQTVLTNFDLESVHDTSDEWIRTRTGISERRVLVHEGTRAITHSLEDPTVGVDKEIEPYKAPIITKDGGPLKLEVKDEEKVASMTYDGQVEKETLRTLGIAAAKNAIEMSGLSPSDIDLVICATSSPDDLFGDAPSIAKACGCGGGGESGKAPLAFDLTAACSGFLFAIITAGQFLENTQNNSGRRNNGNSNGVRNALVLGADALTRWVDWDDRNSCILFGDGAGAMVLTTGSSDSNSKDDESSSSSSSDDQFGILGYAAHSNGGGYEDLKCIYRGEPKKITTPGEGTIVHDGSYDLMTMNGRKVYSFATREVPLVLEEALEEAQITVDQVDWLLLHQANIRIMEVVAERLGIPMEKVITNLNKYGNTSAASIPLALDEAVRSGRVKKGDVIACAGFGAGLSWGAAILKWG